MNKNITCDVLVVGAGPSGFIAAASAAREGVKVILIERYGFIGGMLSAGGVRNIRKPNDGRGNYIFGDLPQQYFELLDQHGGLYRDPLNDNFVQHDPEITKYIAEILCMKYDVHLMYHSVACEALMKGNRITGVRRFSKDGFLDINAKVVIDATGDGDIAYYAGAEFDKDEVLQPMNTTFVMGGVKCYNHERMIVMSPESIKKFKSLESQGLYPVLRRGPGTFTTKRDGEVYINSTRFVGDCTNENELTKGEIACRKQIMDCVKFLKENIPEFKDSFLLSIAPQIGLRESRKIIGRYTMTKDDILLGNDFSDAIAIGSYLIDIHRTDNSTTIIKPNDGIVHKIPYRCLLPVNVEGLIAVGRCISSTQEANSAIRVMATCMGMGQAAGNAAAISVLNDQLPSDVDTDILRKNLIGYGVPLYK